MCVLYEVGIVAARVFGRSRQSGDDGEKLPETGGERGP
jgi:Sec-independent protein secretion pathway component TatC